MLQRNDTGSPLVLPTLDPPRDVPPGGVVDHDEPIAGFTLVHEPPPQEPKPDKSTAAKAAADSATGEGGTAK